MKTRTQKLVVSLLGLCAFIGAAGRLQSQVTVTVDPGQNWVGYMNVSEINGGYEFGSSWGTGALTANFVSTNLLILGPCTTVWETNDTYWVQADGVTPNQSMDANFYVQNDALANTNLVFNGMCLTNTLELNPEPHTGLYYYTQAFIKTFDGAYNLTGEETALMDTGYPFTLSMNTAGAAHVQYGFETTGPDANPATVASLGTVSIAAATTMSSLPAPTNNAPTPPYPASRVLAMFNSSGSYVDHSPERWLAGWSSAAEPGYTIPATSRTVLKYSNLQYAGVEFYDTNSGDNVGGAVNYSINVTNYDTFHVDLWTPNANQFGIQLVSLSPTIAPQVDYLPASGVITSNTWVSLDIPLSTFTGKNPALILSDLQQLLWIDNEGGGGITGGTFYIDNVYFYNSGRPKVAATVSGGSVQLSFATLSGSNYDVQFKNYLSDPTWQTLTTIPGDGNSHMVPDTANRPSRFYRIYVH